MKFRSGKSSKHVARSDPMTAAERRAVFSLAGVFSLRMFGLFLLLPVMTLYATKYDGSTSFKMGLALGIYGLTQACLQIPFGMLSDKFGRKKIIVIGLIVFAIGSVISALAETANGLIIGRAVQGAGAVSSAVLALTADLTRVEQRTKSMALIGISIGASFLLSLIIAPGLAASIGLDGIFWLIGGLASLAIVVLLAIVPSPSTQTRQRDATANFDQLRNVLSNPELRRLDLGIFCLHLILTAIFVAIPGLILKVAQLPAVNHWQLYLPVLALSGLLMLPLVKRGSEPTSTYSAFRLAMGICLIALLWFALFAGNGLYFLAAGLLLFFTGFNALESMLPSLVSQVAPAASKGTAIGVYNTAQFFGMFVGGAGGGWLLSAYGHSGLFWFCSIVMLFWVLIEWRNTAFRLLSSRLLSVGSLSVSRATDLVARIGDVRGVEDVVLVPGESVAYLKVDELNMDNANLEALIRESRQEVR